MGELRICKAAAARLEPGSTARSHQTRRKPSAPNTPPPTLVRSTPRKHRRASRAPPARCKRRPEVVMVFIVAAIADADTAPGDCPPETVALPCRPSGRTGSSRHGCHDRGARVTAPQRRDQIDGGLRRMGCLCRRRGVRAAVCGRSPRRKMRKCDVLQMRCCVGSPLGTIYTRPGTTPTSGLDGCHGGGAPVTAAQRRDRSIRAVRLAGCGPPPTAGVRAAVRGR
jgi:hypothetical protein